MSKRQLDDWLESYLSYTQKSESPTQYHLWSGISAIASVLQRKCYCNWGLRGYIYPNFYLALVGPPGGRKGTAMKIAKEMIQNLGIPTGSDSLGSIQMLYKEIKECENSFIDSANVQKNHKSLSIWSEEFQVFLNDSDDKLIASLTDLFDCANVWRYSTLARGTDDLSNCWLNIIGAITPSTLQLKLGVGAVGGGLLSRIIFIVGYGAIKKVALPFLTKEEEELKEMLNKDLESIALLSGPFKLTSEFLTTYVEWYEHYSINEGIDNEKFLGYNARRALHLNKLCMIFSASESGNMELRKHHFDKARAVLEQAEDEMPNAFYGLGRGAHSEIYANVLRYMEKNKNFSYNDILKQFQLDAMPQDMDQLLNLAESTGKLKRDVSINETRYEVIDLASKKRNYSFLNKTLYKHIGS